MEHVIVDEAQDLSPLSIRVLCDTAKPGAPVTLAGDTAQRLYLDGGFGDWTQLIKDIKLKARILPPLCFVPIHETSHGTCPTCFRLSR